MNRPNPPNGLFGFTGMIALVAAVGLPLGGAAADNVLSVESNSSALEQMVLTSDENLVLKAFAIYDPANLTEVDDVLTTKAMTDLTSILGVGIEGFGGVVGLAINEEADGLDVLAGNAAAAAHMTALALLVAS